MNKYVFIISIVVFAFLTACAPKTIENQRKEQIIKYFKEHLHDPSSLEIVNIFVDTVNRERTLKNINTYTEELRKPKNLKNEQLQNVITKIKYNHKYYLIEIVEYRAKNQYNALKKSDAYFLFDDQNVLIDKINSLSSARRIIFEKRIEPEINMYLAK